MNLKLVALAGAMTLAAPTVGLAQDLTPIGAERGANADGTIPEWAGGDPAGGTLKGMYPANDAYDAEKPLYTITKANLGQFKDKLTAGHQELLERHGSYRMNVYKTHRSVRFPTFIYEATQSNAKACSLKGTDELEGCKVGFPFPRPKGGAEVIWNHKLKWKGNAVRRYNNQLIVQPDGKFTQTKILEEVRFTYATNQGPIPLARGPGEFLRYLSETLSPPRLAGTFILVHDRTGLGTDGRAAWIYQPSLHRLRRAPTVQYDNPYEGTDGNQFYDQVDMFNGALDRYDWKLVGKKEMFLPYNANLIGSPKAKFKDLATARHLNQDFARYELHRFWVVEANLRAGMAHTFKRRVFYVDEDSWSIAAVDCYDNRDKLYKLQEAHLVYQPNVESATGVPELIYDFPSGRYFITAAANEDVPNDFSVTLAPDHFTPDAVQKKILK
jgi:hypothetical protein